MAAIEQEDGKPTGRTITLIFKTEAAQDRRAFAEQFDTLDDFVGSAPIVVFNAAFWRKFLRPELRNVTARGSRRLLVQTIDVSQWARQRFPRQRKDLSSLARKVGVTAISGTDGIVLDVTLLAGIAAKMNVRSDHVISGQRASLEHLPSAPIVEAPSVVPRSLGGRLALCWRVLIGQA